MEPTFKFVEPKQIFNVNVKTHLKILNKRYSSMFKVIETNFDNFGFFLCCSIFKVMEANSR